MLTSRGNLSGKSSVNNTCMRIRKIRGNHKGAGEGNRSCGNRGSAHTSLCVRTHNK